MVGDCGSQVWEGKQLKKAGHPAFVALAAAFVALAVTVATAVAQSTAALAVSAAAR